MEKYLDEEIIRAKREEKKKKYTTIQTGMYAGDILLDFRMQELFDGRIQIMMPSQFTRMDIETAKKKYPSEMRPNLIYTDESGEVNLTFSLFEQYAGSSQIEGTLRRYQELIRKGRQDAEMLSRGSWEIEGTYCGWFDFRNNALDEVLYNLLAVVGLKKYLILGMFNCMYDDRDKWRDIMERILRSIQGEG